MRKRLKKNKLFTFMQSIKCILTLQNCIGCQFIIFMDFLGDSVAFVSFGTKIQ